MHDLVLARANPDMEAVARMLETTALIDNGLPIEVNKCTDRDDEIVTSRPLEIDRPVDRPGLREVTLTLPAIHP